MIKSLYNAFKHWTNGGSAWVISDTHFDDPDCKYMDKRWISSEEQIDIINEYIYRSDYLIHLGDVGNPKWLEKIKCKNRILLTGNHDKPHLLTPYFSEVYIGPLFIADRILLSHEPIMGLEDFCVNIHGHDHNGIERNNHINLAANICNYTPLSLGASIKSGILTNCKNYHRVTIDSIPKKNNLSEKRYL